ncbi:MAG: CBS domain-containing protein, partial [Actinomycetota bacterium]|nr:CBS domain-containing protein [Actinomycetota bacterium]
PDTTAREVLKILRDNTVPGVPVVGGDGKLEGFVTDGHLMGSALPRYMKMMGNLSFVPDSADEWVHYLTDAADKPVREVMSREVSQVELGKSELAVLADHRADRPPLAGPPAPGEARHRHRRLRKLFDTGAVPRLLRVLLLNR